MVDIIEVAENIYLIDNQLYSVPEWGSTYLLKEEKTALIDPGPTTSAPAVLAGLKKLGVRPEDLDYIIATHIHLDHSGGAGFLLRSMLQAQVIVHQRGTRHLASPEKLMQSVIQVEGEKAAAENGVVVPVPVERLRSVGDGDELKLGEKQKLRFMDAPGHAPHELCIYETRNRGVFTGDAAGIFVWPIKLLLQNSPPPNFDLDLSISTLERLAGMRPSKIYFGHFGATDKVLEMLQLLREKMLAWDAIMAEIVKEGGHDHIAERLLAQPLAELEPARRIPALYNHLVRALLPRSVNGYKKYYQEKHGVKLI